MKKGKSGGIRMLKLIESGKIALHGGQCIDLYNQQVRNEVFVTVTTRIDHCNHYYVTQVIET